MATENTDPSRPRHIGWAVGLSFVFLAVLSGAILPAVMVFLLGCGPEVAGGAMLGGFLMTWLIMLSAFRGGQRRGWWA